MKEHEFIKNYTSNKINMLFFFSHPWTSSLTLFMQSCDQSFLCIWLVSFIAFVLEQVYLYC